MDVGLDDGKAYKKTEFESKGKGWVVSATVCNGDVDNGGKNQSRSKPESQLFLVRCEACVNIGIESSGSHPPLDEGGEGEEEHVGQNEASHGDRAKENEEHGDGVAGLQSPVKEPDNQRRC